MGKYSKSPLFTQASPFSQVKSKEMEFSLYTLKNILMVWVKTLTKLCIHFSHPCIYYWNKLKQWNEKLSRSNMMQIQRVVLFPTEGTQRDFLLSHRAWSAKYFEAVVIPVSEPHSPSCLYLYLGTLQFSSPGESLHWWLPTGYLPKLVHAA